MVAPGPEEVARWESVYREHFPLLSRIARVKFGVPEDEAETLAQDVLLSYVYSAASIQSIRSWLIAATCNASRNYWRARTRLEPLEETTTPEPQAPQNAHDQASVTQLLGRVTGKYREAVRLRYLEGCSTKEVAARLNTTSRYAEKLLRIGLERMRGQK